MAANSVSSSTSWEDFVKDNLLCDNLLDGILLLSSCGENIYSWGVFKCSQMITKEECKQFIGIFDAITEKQDLVICQRGFKLTTADNGKVHYKVYKKTYCSMFCVSDNCESGLVVCNIPYGVLITTHHHHHAVKVQEVIDVIERACILLRS